MNGNKNEISYNFESKFEMSVDTSRKTNLTNKSCTYVLMLLIIGSQRKKEREKSNIYCQTRNFKGLIVRVVQPSCLSFFKLFFRMIYTLIFFKVSTKALALYILKCLSTGAYTESKYQHHTVYT